MGRNIVQGFLMLIGILVFLFLINYRVYGNTYEDFTEKELIRFHIRAESNEKYDQEIKMQVRTAVLDYVQNQSLKWKNKKEMRTGILAHRKELESVISNVLRQSQKECPISIYFTEEFFPMRKYGQTILPAGMYEALRIDLGKAKGRNWWCMLYPSLCLIDTDHVLENPEEKEHLDAVLNGEYKIEYQSYFKKMITAILNESGRP